ncbi:MAG TPA: hypothetical protein VHA79_09890 [Mycobacteriales bacterium]|nr:hypothetical protein [Mycobacteriales bacterium]
MRVEDRGDTVAPRDHHAVVDNSRDDMLAALAVDESQHARPDQHGASGGVDGARGCTFHLSAPFSWSSLR